MRDRRLTHRLKGVGKHEAKKSALVLLDARRLAGVVEVAAIKCGLQYMPTNKLPPSISVTSRRLVRFRRITCRRTGCLQVGKAKCRALHGLSGCQIDFRPDSELLSLLCCQISLLCSLVGIPNSYFSISVRSLYDTGHHINASVGSSAQISFNAAINVYFVI